MRNVLRLASIFAVCALNGWAVDLFIDSFDHYAVTGDKWSTAGLGAIDLTGTRSRTGIGACITDPVSGGPEWNYPTPQTGIIVGTAYNSPVLGGDIFGLISGFGIGRKVQVRLIANGDGSITIAFGKAPDPVVILGTTDPNVIAPGMYFYIEMMVSAFSTTGTVTLNINGQTVFADTGNTDPAVSGSVDTVYLGFPPALSAAFDDFYTRNFVDSGLSLNPATGFTGPQRMYAGTAFSDDFNGWIPSAGTDNWPLVSEIPPDDGATYVEAGVPQLPTPREIYLIKPPAYLIGSDWEVTAVQLNMDAALDAPGSATICPVMQSVTAGTDGDPIVLTTAAYHIYTQAYNADPSFLPFAPLQHWNVAFMPNSGFRLLASTGSNARVTQFVREVGVVPKVSVQPKAKTSQPNNTIVGGRPAILRAKSAATAHVTQYNQCLEAMAYQYKKIVPYLRPSSIPDEWKNLLPWDETFGAIPPQAKTFYATKGITTPLASAGDVVVVQRRVPTGWDGILSGFFFQYSGTGFAQGSGDIIWRIQRNQWYMKDLSNSPYLLGNEQEPVPMTEGQLLQSGQLISAIVNVPNLSGLIEVGESTVYAGLIGFWWPR